MDIRAGVRNALWMAAGAVIFAAVLLLVFHWHAGGNPAEELAAKSARLQTVGQMRLDLSAASEAEKSAVLAVTDEESKTFADQARRSTDAVEQGRQELERLPARGGTEQEKNRLAQFTQAFAEFQKVDAQVLDLAVRNTNLKAYALAFGPAAKEIGSFDGALSRLAEANAAAPDSPDAAPNAMQAVLAASDARAAALRIQALLAPHIAEESDQRMDEMEADMARDDQEVRNDLDRLSNLAGLREPQDFEEARSAYGRFNVLRSQILSLSRENTNVRSLGLSLHQKRNVAAVCQEVLAVLQQAIQEEPVPGITYGMPARPK